jgi:hypothetical protein
VNKNYDFESKLTLKNHSIMIKVKPFFLLSYFKNKNLMISHNNDQVYIYAAAVHTHDIIFHSR